MWPLPAVAAACVCALAAAALWLLRRPLRRWRRLVAFSAQLAGPALPRLSLGEDPLAAFADACRRYGTPCRVWVGARLYVLLTDPEHAAAVLGGGGGGGGGGFHERAGLRQWDALRPFTGRGLATAAAGDGWSRRRRLVEQTLTPQWVQSQSGWLRRVADRLVAALQQVAPPAEQQLQVLKELRACTLDALAGSLLGQQARATGRPPAGFPHHFLQATQLIDQQAGRQPALLSPLRLLSLAGGGQAGPRLVRQLRGYIDAAVDTAAHSSTRGQERHIALSWERAADSGDDPDRLPGSALEQLLSATEDRRLVSEELASLLLVGQPATEAALCFTLQLLALHPQVQTAAARDEQLLRRAVLESLRLFPVQPLLARQLSEDVKLPPAGGRGQLLLPQGCIAVVCSPLTHRDPEHWPDPDAFQPDRFLEEHEARRHPFAYLAFGGGARRCPGSELSLQLLCAVLSRLLSAFRIATAGDSRDHLQDLRLRAVLSPRRGFQLRLLPRA
ncbi:cytochrome P450 4C1-like [Schistocerca americana]|uniref:cytochrome P450 4C1-like n=1 Tax=Schistocerca americana TaxID=7009 RepID=UPI001F4F8F47|nr:cytochrome P450 4C1-like [Schistocerca americana]